MNIEIRNQKFYIGEKPCKLVSGAMHYFRVPRSHWRDRLLKLAEMGCNCVETYCAWNLHEPREGVLDFSGNLDLGEYLDLAKELGLYAVVRPGPYMCAEWDMGGLPWWLLAYDGMQLRSSDPLYLQKTERYLSAVCDVLRPRLLSAGGNVIMLQLENEYGGYGNDRDYLLWLKRFYEEHGLDCLFVTSDSEFDLLTHNGTLPGVCGMVNCAADVEECWNLSAGLRGNVPPAVMEFWTGGRTFFQKEGQNDLERSANALREALDFTEFLNIFKFHGGTSFGFNGGSCRDYRKRRMDYYRPSYDCYSPLDQFGRRTEKYYRFREIICRARGVSVGNTAEDAVLHSLGTIEFLSAAPLASCREILDRHESVGLYPMEKYGQGYGYILYETSAFVGKDGVMLVLPQVHDSAHIYVDGEYLASVERDRERELRIGGGPRTVRLSIFVENRGRIKFGPGIRDPKGLVGDLYFYDLSYGIYSKLFHFDVFTLEFDKLPALTSAPVRTRHPALYFYRFRTEGAADALLELRGFTRGVVLVNGHNLGRYENGKLAEDMRLYLPRDFVRKGENHLLVFDVLANRKRKSVSFLEEETCESVRGENEGNFS